MQDVYCDRSSPYVKKREGEHGAPPPAVQQARKPRSARGTGPEDRHELALAEADHEGD